MLYMGLVAGIVICAIQAIRVARLLTASLWLACTSALLSVLLYEIGGREIAVIELSVGAGLVTILFVFALSLIGDDAAKSQTMIPKPLAGAACVAITLLLGWLAANLPAQSPTAASTLPTFSITLWQDRGLDVLAQITLIFAGVLGILGLLGEVKAPIASGRASVPVTVPDSQETETEAAPAVEEREEAYA
jgi:NADH:ubiquinone oxidoreductase subunit 6 (subunit J)